MTTYNENNVVGLPYDPALGTLFNSLYNTIVEFSQRHNPSYAAVIGVLDMLKYDMLTNAMNPVEEDDYE